MKCRCHPTCSERRNQSSLLCGPVSDLFALQQATVSVLQGCLACACAYGEDGARLCTKEERAQPAEAAPPRAGLACWGWTPPLANTLTTLLHSRWAAQS